MIAYLMIIGYTLECKLYFIRWKNAFYKQWGGRYEDDQESLEFTLWASLTIHSWDPHETLKGDKFLLIMYKVLTFFNIAYVQSGCNSFFLALPK